MKRLLTVAASLLLLLAFARPAEAATTPAKVGLVSIQAATTSSLTLHWPKAAYATRYEVLVANNESMTGYWVKSAGNVLAYTVTGLTKGRIYCFAVRARNGSATGSRSAHTCKEPIRQQGATAGANYKIVTYNLCSEKCTNWVNRGPLAVKLITGQNPDVIALQEAGALTGIPGYSNTTDKSAKKLLFRTSRFDLATTTCPPGDHGCDPEPRTGFVEMNPTKYAVWAELIDHASADKHVIFVSVHTTSGKTETAALARKHEIQVLLPAMDAINTGGLPIVYAGDFNSHRNRPNDYLAGVFHTAGYWDSYELASALYRPNYNTYNDWSKTPVISRTWGDHVDHVWVKPAVGVVNWASVAFFADGRYVTLPSDHNPLAVRILVP